MGLWSDYVTRWETPTGFDWAEVVQSATPESLNAYQKAKDSANLLAAIRSKGIKGAENYVLIPKNLGAQFPWAHQIMLASAQLIGKTLIEDNEAPLALRLSDPFSLDPQTRQKGIDLLFTKDGKEDLMDRQAVCDITAVVESLTRIPDESAFKMSGPGKQAIAYIVHLICTVYAEQVEGMGATKHSHLWRLGMAYRRTLVASMGRVLGGEKPASRFLSAIETLYRLFLRQTLTNASSERMFVFTQLVRTHITRMTRAPAEIFRHYLPRARKTEERKVAATFDAKGKPATVKTEKISVLKMQRPIPDLGKQVSDFERTLLEHVFRSVAKVEDELATPLYCCESLVDWDQDLKKLADEYCKAFRPLAQELLERKRAIRSRAIEEETQKAAAAQPSGAAKAKPAEVKFTMPLWERYAALVETEQRNRWIEKTISFLSNLFEVPPEEVPKLRERPEKEIRLSFQALMRRGVSGVRATPEIWKIQNSDRNAFPRDYTDEVRRAAFEQASKSPISEEDEQTPPPEPTVVVKVDGIEDLRLPAVQWHAVCSYWGIARTVQPTPTPPIDGVEITRKEAKSRAGAFYMLMRGKGLPSWQWQKKNDKDIQFTSEEVDLINAGPDGLLATGSQKD
jgi:hypothetical protein